MEKCKVCNQEKPLDEMSRNYHDEAISYTCHDCSEKRYKENHTLLSERHDDIDSAIMIKDYPYGYTLRCKMRYWIETTKRGDRFCRQSLNPKTNQWNKPKKTTYSDVMVIVTNEKDHVSYRSWTVSYSEESSLIRFLGFIGEGYLFNEMQLQKMREGRAIYKTRKHISYEIKSSCNLSESEKEQKKDEQIKTKKNIGFLYAHYLSQES